MQGLLEPFNITRYYTDDWGAYERHIFSKLEKMHDIVGIVHFLVDTFYCKEV